MDPTGSMLSNVVPSATPNASVVSDPVPRPPASPSPRSVAEESSVSGNEVTVETVNPDPEADAKLESLLKAEMLMLASGILLAIPPSLIITSSMSVALVVLAGVSAVSTVSTVDPFTYRLASLMFTPDESSEEIVLTERVPATCSVDDSYNGDVTDISVESLAPI